MKRQRDLTCYETLDESNNEEVLNYGDVILEICLNNDAFHNTITPFSARYGPFFHIMDRKFGNSEWWKGDSMSRNHFQTKVMYVHDESQSVESSQDEDSIPVSSVSGHYGYYTYPPALVRGRRFSLFYSYPCSVGIRTCEDERKLRGPYIPQQEVYLLKPLGKCATVKAVFIEAVECGEPFIHHYVIYHALENPFEDLTFFQALNDYRKTTNSLYFFPTKTKRVNENMFFYLNKFLS